LIGTATTAAEKAVDFDGWMQLIGAIARLLDAPDER
jgi:hypothetical protein